MHSYAVARANKRLSLLQNARIIPKLVPNDHSYTRQHLFLLSRS